MNYRRSEKLYKLHIFFERRCPLNLSFRDVIGNRLQSFGHHDSTYCHLKGFRSTTLMRDDDVLNCRLLQMLGEVFKRKDVY